MLELAGILSSDTVNRYGSRFSSGAMMEALRAHWRTGLPSTISHDAHRLAGWTLPTAVSITTAATRLHGASFVPETEDEQTALDARYQHHLSLRIAEEAKPHIDDLREAVNPHLVGDEEPHIAAATALVGVDLARRVAAKVFADEDKDGLVDLKGLETLQPGMFKYGDLVLFAHPFFRRSLSRWNNLNAALLSDLEALREAEDSTVRVRLDPDMVGWAASTSRALEFDYWYGPKFDDDLTAIPTGVTHHEAKERERHFFGISRTEFWWQSRDDQHILEAEEVRDLPTLGTGTEDYGCRYVHSIVDENTGNVFHLDGAIRSYDEGALVERLDSSIAEAGRRSQYTKLWRVDGHVPLSQWKRLIHSHFRDNPLVGEYLFQAAEAPGEQSAPSSVPPDPRNRMVPHAVDAGEGAAVLLSLHELSQDTAQPRELQPLEKITAYGVERDVIDADSVELRKALTRRGQGIQIPDDALRIAFEDRYLTLPLIRHRDSSDVAATLDALGDIFAGWTRHENDDRALAFSLSAPVDQVDLRCSVYGHVRDLQAVLASLGGLFQSKALEDVVAWVDSFSTAIRRSEAMDGTFSSRFDAMITPHQTYRVTRQQIDREDFVPSVEGGTILHQLRLPADDEALVAAVRAGELGAALAWVIEDANCTGCSKTYATCPCSKVLDEGVTQRCTQAQIAYPFWTDRPA